MTLIKSISGIRGTIGGSAGGNLTPLDLVKFTAAYSQWLREDRATPKLKVVLGRDARISGEMAVRIVEGTLLGCGIDVINIGMAATPTVEMAVTGKKADGGIILTASHNPKQWNALKLLNHKGEFINDADGKRILSIAQADAFLFAEVDDLGRVIETGSYDDQHIAAVLALPLVDVQAIRAARLKVVVDAVNSVGGIVIPALLECLGVEVVKLNCEPDGQFAHNPEPLPEHLTALSQKVVEEKADLGIAVDPDVDRLALVCENGNMFGEEYTLVAVADYVLSNTRGNAVSNLSSSRALKDITQKHGGTYYASAVGEVNVVAMMKQTNADIGGEGNGGIIYPELHYGRDALVGVALFLTHLVKSGLRCSALRATYPNYETSKNRIELTPCMDADAILDRVKRNYRNERINDIDGVKIDFADGWVHLRKSNTEPIIRVYSESDTLEKAKAMADRIIADVKTIAGLA